MNTVEFAAEVNVELISTLETLRKLSDAELALVGGGSVVINNG